MPLFLWIWHKFLQPLFNKWFGTSQEKIKDSGTEKIKNGSLETNNEKVRFNYCWTSKVMIKIFKMHVYFFFQISRNLGLKNLLSHKINFDDLIFEKSSSDMIIGEDRIMR